MFKQIPKYKIYCKDCGLEYGTEDWMDTSVQNDQWNLICPNDGILCANCIIRRAARLPYSYGFVVMEMRMKHISEYN